ncbi:MAG: DUF4469 domain-containing protein [Treponema sp.]|nr:DUF4469 domain-containing protein [Treponema sp.]
MDNKKNVLSDTVNVTIHQSYLQDENASYGKVQRNTAYIGNVIEAIVRQNNTLKEETLLFAAGLLRDGMLELLSQGKAVDVLELGVIYPKVSESMDTATPDVSDIPQLVLGYTASTKALSAVAHLTAGATIAAQSVPVIKEAWDMKQCAANGTLTAGQGVRLTGRKLKIAGKAEATGVFFVPVDDSGSIDESGSNWIRAAETKKLSQNTQGTLLFVLNKDIAPGTYKIVIKTAFGNGERVNKTVRTGMMSASVKVRADS